MNSKIISETTDRKILEMTTDIVSSFVSNNSISASDLPALIKSIHGTVATLADASGLGPPRPEPAVGIFVEKIGSPSYLVLRRTGRFSGRSFPS